MIIFIVLLLGLSNYCAAQDFSSSSLSISSSVSSSSLSPDPTQEMLNRLNEVEDKLIEQHSSQDMSIVATSEVPIGKSSSSIAKEPSIELLRSEIVLRDAEIATLKEEISKINGNYAICSQGLEEKRKMLEKIPELHTKFQTYEGQITILKKEAETCRVDLEKAQASAVVADKLEKDLIVARNELLLKERELKLFSRASTPRTRERVATAMASSRTERRASEYNPQRTAPPNTYSQSSAPSDVLVVEVIDSKVNLRSGPGEEHSPVMQVPLGSRLTVEAQEGEWYRVYTPTGSRAYIRSDLVKKISDISSSRPTRRTTPSKPPVRIGVDESEYESFGNMQGSVSPYSKTRATPEDRALERLRRLQPEKP